MIEYPCRCGGKTDLKPKTEVTQGILIRDVPVLICRECGEEWYPPGIPRLIEGLREVATNLGKVEISAEPVKQS